MCTSGLWMMKERLEVLRCPICAFKRILGKANAANVVGTRIVVARCKNQLAYQWTMDCEGKIKNVMSPTMCIEFSGKKMQMAKCVSGQTKQRWAYCFWEQGCVIDKLF